MSLELILGAISAVVAFVVTAFLTGGRMARKKAERDKLKDYRETRERMDDEEHLGDDPAVARDWLRLRENDKR